MNITFDKRLDLIFGLIYSASKDNNYNFRWAADMNPEYDEKFYQIYKKGITSEFENYIVSGGLDSYTRCVSIALSLNENYEVVENRDIQQIYSRNSIFNSEKLSAYLKEFVEKSHYEEFYAS